MFSHPLMTWNAFFLRKKKIKMWNWARDIQSVERRAFSKPPLQSRSQLPIAEPKWDPIKHEHVALASWVENGGSDRHDAGLIPFSPLTKNLLRSSVCFPCSFPISSSSSATAAAAQTAFALVNPYLSPTRILQDDDESSSCRGGR